MSNHIVIITYFGHRSAVFKNAKILSTGLHATTLLAISALIFLQNSRIIALAEKNDLQDLSSK